MACSEAIAVPASREITLSFKYDEYSMLTVSFGEKFSLGHTLDLGKKDRTWLMESGELPAEGEKPIHLPHGPGYEFVWGLVLTSKGVKMSSFGDGLQGEISLSPEEWIVLRDELRQGLPLLSGEE